MSVITSVGVLLAATPPAEADGFQGAFSAVATAHGLRLQLVVPNAPVTNNVIDAGGPSALAVVDSLGDSHAYGSFPFPGESAAAAPGLVRGLSGAPIPPDYPFFVASRYPAAPKQELDAGLVTLHATSSADASAATAGFGVVAEGVAMVAAERSDAATRLTEDGVVSTSTSGISGLQIGPLGIAQILSTANVRLSAEGVRTKKAETKIIGAVVNNTPVVISPGGVVVQNTPVPGTAPMPAAQALTGAGLSVELVPMTQSENGVDAPAVRITRKMSSGQSMVLTLGVAAASIDRPGDAVIPASGGSSASGYTSWTGHTGRAAGGGDVPGGVVSTSRLGTVDGVASLPTTSALADSSAMTTAPPIQDPITNPNNPSAGRVAPAPGGAPPSAINAAVLLRSADSPVLWTAMLVAALCAVGMTVAASGRRATAR